MADHLDVRTLGFDAREQFCIWLQEEFIEHARRDDESVVSGEAIVGAAHARLLGQPGDHMVGKDRVVQDAQTGGRSFFISKAQELESVYAQIERELRSQYLVAYQSTARSPRDHYREIELDVRRKGLKAKTMRGYYP